MIYFFEGRYYDLFFFLAEGNGINRSITMNWAKFLILCWILVLVQTPYVVPARRDDVGKLISLELPGYDIKGS